MVRTAIPAGVIQMLEAQAAYVACSCWPDKRGTTAGDHHAWCSWNDWMGGFEAALEMLEYDTNQLPDIKILAGVKEGE